MPIELWKIAQLYYECLQLGTSPKQWDTKLGDISKYKTQKLLLLNDVHPHI